MLLVAEEKGTASEGWAGSYTGHLLSKTHTSTLPTRPIPVFPRYWESNTLVSSQQKTKNIAVSNTSGLSTKLIQGDPHDQNPFADTFLRESDHLGST